MKSEETFKTTRESGDDEFEAEKRKAEAKSKQAAIAASFSQRDLDDGEEPFRHLVRVRAVERPGLDGMRRGGHFWPSALPGTVARVTPRLYKAIRAEALLHVEALDPEDVVDFDDPGIAPLAIESTKTGEERARDIASGRASNGQLDVPVRHRAPLPNAPAPAQAASEDMLRLAFEAGRMSVENDRLRAEIAQLKAAEEPKPKAEAKKPEPKPTEEPKPLG